MTGTGPSAFAAVREPAVAGTFYPADPGRLHALVARLLDEAEWVQGPWPAGAGRPLALLVPHAGLEYSGAVAAGAWRLLADHARAGSAQAAPTVVVLGTNHRAELDGIGAWDHGSWRIPLGASAVDEDLAARIVALGEPVQVDFGSHRGEHSIEVQLPFLQTVAPEARIVPLAVAAGVGDRALDFGERLGAVLASAWRAASPLVLAISTDMAHYPPRRVAEWVTAELLPPILELDPVALAAVEATIRARGLPGVACGMCGIEPAIVGLAALRTAGAARGVSLAAATSADAGGAGDQAVGYLSVAFA